MRGGAEEVADAQRYPAGEVSDARRYQNARRGIPRGRYPAGGIPRGRYQMHGGIPRGRYQNARGGVIYQTRGEVSRGGGISRG